MVSENFPPYGRALKECMCIQVRISCCQWTVKHEGKLTQLTVAASSPNSVSTANHLGVPWPYRSRDNLKSELGDGSQLSPYQKLLILLQTFVREADWLFTREKIQQAISLELNFIAFNVVNSSFFFLLAEDFWCVLKFLFENRNKIN